MNNDNITAMYLKIPSDLKTILKNRASKERITLAGLTISCIRSGLANRLESSTLEDAKINELIQGAVSHE